MFRAYVLSIIWSLNTVYTAIGIYHAEILKLSKITNVYTCVHVFTPKSTQLNHFHPDLASRQ